MSRKKDIETNISGREKYFYTRRKNISITKILINKNAGIPGTENYYNEQHKLDGNSQGKLPNEIKIVKDYNFRRVNSKLFKNCLKVFICCLVLDAFILKSLLFIGIVVVLGTVIYIRTFINTY